MVAIVLRAENLKIGKVKYFDAFKKNIIGNKILKIVEETIRDNKIKSVDEYFNFFEHASRNHNVFSRLEDGEEIRKKLYQDAMKAIDDPKKIIQEYDDAAENAARIVLARLNGPESGRKIPIFSCKPR